MNRADAVPTPTRMGDTPSGQPTGEPPSSALRREFSHAMQRSQHTMDMAEPAYAAVSEARATYCLMGVAWTTQSLPEASLANLRLEAAAGPNSTFAPALQAPKAPDGPAVGHTPAGARPHTPQPRPATPGMSSLFDRLVRLIDLSPTHSERIWRLSVRLHDEVLSGTVLCIESVLGRTELRFTPGSPQAARELEAVVEGWSQRLSARAGRPVAVRLSPFTMDAPEAGPPSDAWRSTP